MQIGKGEKPFLAENQLNSTLLRCNWCRIEKVRIAKEIITQSGKDTHQSWKFINKSMHRIVVNMTKSINRVAKVRRDDKNFFSLNGTRAWSSKHPLVSPILMINIGVLVLFYQCLLLVLVLIKSTALILPKKQQWIQCSSNQTDGMECQESTLQCNNTNGTM